jgi:hypothetical protein
MGDYTLPPANTLIVGMTGSGKSTFALTYLRHAPATCVFIFDDMGRAATRLGIRPCGTARECEEALASRWVVFNPNRMFPGDTAAAFRWFCQWTYDAACRGPGKKFLHVDEVWQWQTPQGIPRELALVAQAGREENLELVICTQLPHRINASLTGQATEIVCFRLDEPLALAKVRELGCAPAIVQQLPLGAFVARNRLSGGALKGRVF